MSVGRQPLEIKVVGRHVRLSLNGRILMHSEEYSSVTKANRAALRLEDAILTRPLRVWILRWVAKRWVYRTRTIAGVRITL